MPARKKATSRKPVAKKGRVLTPAQQKRSDAMKASWEKRRAAQAAEAQGVEEAPAKPQKRSQAKKVVVPGYVRTTKVESVPENSGSGGSAQIEAVIVEPIPVVEHPGLYQSTPTGLGEAALAEEARIRDAAPPASAEEIHIIHFVNDGLTAWGKVWVRGEEKKVGVPSPEYEATCRPAERFSQAIGRHVDSWLELSAAEQETVWGEQKFAKGPWKGEDMPLTEDDAFRALQSNDPEAYKRIEKQRQRQAVPAR